MQQHDFPSSTTPLDCCIETDYIQIHNVLELDGQLRFSKVFQHFKGKHILRTNALTFSRLKQLSKSKVKPDAVFESKFQAQVRMTRE